MKSLGISVLLLNLASPLAAQTICKPLPHVEQRICLKAVDATPLGQRIPLVLIHGWNRSWPGEPHLEIWDNMIFYFGTTPWVGENFKIYEVTYWSNLDSVTDIASSFADLVDEYPAWAGRKLFLVGHSMGGLVALSYMTESGEGNGERVLHLTALGVPFLGTPAANGPARDAAAGPLASLVLNVFDKALFQDGLWSEYNRFDLRSGKKLQWATKFDFDRFPQDDNLWLDHLIDANPYSAKLSTYAGIITDPEQRCGSFDPSNQSFDLLGCSGKLMKELYSNLDTDGIVPQLSANINSCEGCTMSEFLFGYDHYQIAQGKSPYDSYLFGALLGDLSEAIASTDPRFNGEVILGNPASEAFHNLRGWGEPSRDSHGTYRAQTAGLMNSVDLFVSETNTPHTLVFSEAGSCNKNFFAYVNIGSIDMPLDLFLDPNQYQCLQKGSVAEYIAQLPDYLVRQQRIRVRFFDAIGDGSGSAPVYSVKIVQ